MACVYMVSKICYPTPFFHLDRMWSTSIRTNCVKAQLSAGCRGEDHQECKCSTCAHAGLHPRQPVPFLTALQLVVSNSWRQVCPPMLGQVVGPATSVTKWSGLNVPFCHTGYLPDSVGGTHRLAAHSGTLAHACIALGPLVTYCLYRYIVATTYIHTYACDPVRQSVA